MLSFKPGKFIQFTPTKWDILPDPSGSNPGFLEDDDQSDDEMLDRSIRIYTDLELDAMLPTFDYIIVPEPAGYSSSADASQKTSASALFAQTAEPSLSKLDAQLLRQTPAHLPDLKASDHGVFGVLLTPKEADDDAAASKERFLLELLLKLKNGDAAQRKLALRRLSSRALFFGPKLLFQKLLLILMSSSLDEHERHLMVKVIDRVLGKLGAAVQPFVKDILVVIEPLLIDDDRMVREEGSEIVSNLSKAAGLKVMIETLRPSIDNVDEFVRSSTARALAIVGRALGVHALVPFVRAVCASAKSWHARHTGCKIVQQLAALSGPSVLSHLPSLVAALEPCLVDPQPPVRTVAALAVAALAEAASPYGIEAFTRVIQAVFFGFQKHRGKTLAAFLRAMGALVPLMESEFASHYTRQLMRVLVREFKTTDDQMKRIVLAVVSHCIATDGVSPAYIRDEILPEFFPAFWLPAVTAQKRVCAPLVATTIDLASRVGVSAIVERVVGGLHDPSQHHARVVLETVDKIVQQLGAADLSPQLEKRLVEGILFAFQQQLNLLSPDAARHDPHQPALATSAQQPPAAALPSGSGVMLHAFGTVINALGARAKGHLPEICNAIRIRLAFRDPAIRQQAADLIARVAPVMMRCGEEALLGRLGTILFEMLGEEYPDVLGSILAALKEIISVIGMDKMTPPIGELVPRLTPILKNRNENVSENCIQLVGAIADRGDRYVSPREWMRICFDLLDMLSMAKKAIHKATVKTIGFIAKAIGPQDVLGTLLNNLKIQDRAVRVCTTVAIAIVAETCGPFTVLPLLLNEYRVPELNVRTGVLKSISFLFEYLTGEVARDYLYSVVTLLQDALTERDLVHRQTACTVIKHMALDVVGMGCEDALLHLLNFVWPNIFETSPHVISAVMEAITALTIALGAGVIFQYTLQGLFHPARKVRQIYWEIYQRLHQSSPEALVPVFPHYPSQSSLEDLDETEVQVVEPWIQQIPLYTPQELFLFF